MPVKKNNKKNSSAPKNKVHQAKATKKTKKKVTKKSKEILEMKQAVKDLTSVLAKEMQNVNDFSEEKVSINIQRDTVVPVRKMSTIYRSPQNSQKWLWTAVILFTIIIFALWILNVSNIFYDSRDDSNGPLDSLKSSKEELENIFNNVNSDIVTSTQKIEGEFQKEFSESSADKNIEDKLENAMKSLIGNTTNTNNNLTTSTN